MKILLVDDDEDLLDLLTYALGREGYRVVTATSAEAALARLHAEPPDLVLLDINLPTLDGFEVCRRIRQASSTPVIMLTVRQDEADVVRGLAVGADDYVTKPFSVRQLAARMRAVLHRARCGHPRRPTSEVRAGDLVLDLQTHTVRAGPPEGHPIQLTRTEFLLLRLLATNAGRVVPYRRLVEYAWGYDTAEGPALLKPHITHLRRKLGRTVSGAGSIRNVDGLGYTLTARAT